MIRPDTLNNQFLLNVSQGDVYVLKKDYGFFFFF